MSEILLPMLSSRIFMVSGLTFKSLIHFELILVCGVRRWSSFIFLQVSVQFSQHHFLDKLSSAHCMCLLPLSYINWLWRWKFIYGLSILFHWPMCLFLCQYQAVLFFFRITVARQGLLWFHISFWNICSSSVKYVIGILVGIVLNLQIALGSVDILMMLILPIHEYSVCFHLLVSSSISFFSVL